MIRPALLVAAFLFGTAPALAYPNCLTSGGPGLYVEFGVGIGEFSEAEQSEFDKMRLRRIGINADVTERTPLGCIKVTRVENGRWVMEYYDPKTLELVPVN